MDGEFKKAKQKLKHPLDVHSPRGSHDPIVRGKSKRNQKLKLVFRNLSTISTKLTWRRTTDFEKMTKKTNLENCTKNKTKSSQKSEKFS